MNGLWPEGHANLPTPSPARRFRCHSRSPAPMNPHPAPFPACLSRRHHLGEHVSWASLTQHPWGHPWNQLTLHITDRQGRVPLMLAHNRQQVGCLSQPLFPQPQKRSLFPGTHTSAGAVLRPLLHPSPGHFCFGRWILSCSRAKQSANA